MTENPWRLVPLRMHVFDFVKAAELAARSNNPEHLQRYEEEKSRADVFTVILEHAAKVGYSP